MDELTQIEQELATKCYFCLGAGVSGGVWCTVCGGSGLERTQIWTVRRAHSVFGVLYSYPVATLEQPPPYLEKFGACNDRARRD